MSLGMSTTWVPSVAAFDEAGELLVGEDADRSDDAIRSIKTCITMNQKTLVVEGGGERIEVDADLIATSIIKEAIDRTLDLDPAFDLSSLRVGCPAEWERHQRERLQRILKKAGVDVALADILDEPVAAAISWIDQRQRSEDKPSEDKSRVVVFDYGGGTLDIAVCEITWKHHHPEITVLSCDGVTDAGDALDDALVDYVARRIDVQLQDPALGLARAAIRLAARRAKEDLSVVERTVVDLSPYGLPNLDLTRQELENLFRPQLERALQFATYCLRGAKLRELDHLPPAALRQVTFAELAREIDQVVLAGGLSQIPLVRSLMQAKFPRARIDHSSEGQGVGPRRPQHSIVAGLVHDPETYDRLNLHRPGFNIRLTWRDAHGAQVEEVLYEAHTRIYGAQDIFMNVARPRYYRLLAIPARTPSQQATLEVTSESGEPLQMRIDGSPLSAVNVGVRGGDLVAISLYVDGRLMILVNDEPQRFGNNATTVRVERWHVVRGRRRVIDLTTIDKPKLPNFAYPHK